MTATTISQTVTNYGMTAGIVAGSTATVNLAWSAVLQSAQHTAADTDGFTLKVYDNTTSTVVKLVSYNAVSALSLFTVLGSYLYSGWRAESIAVTAGDSITVSLLATDCDAGGHFGYVYLSSFGTAPVGGSAPLVPGSAPSIPDIVSGNNRTSGNPTGFNLLSSVAGGSSFNNRFDGGALRVDSTATSSASFTITANKGYIDQYGNNATFGGQFTDDTAGVGGRLVIQNSATGGSVSLTNTHNTYSGGTEVNAGANLTINAGGALGSGAIDLVGTLTTPASLTVTQSTTIANNITVAYDPVINVATGQTTTITGTITNGVAPGDLVVNNDGSSTGTLVLTPGVAGANTYSGGTFVNAGVLQAGGVDALPTTGSVSVASGATFDLNSYNQQIGSLVGAGNTTLGSGTLTLANAADTFSGAISGAGALNITGGTETLSGANTYTGPTNVNGGTLNLTGTLLALL